MKTLHRIIRALKKVIFPTRCVLCGVFYSSQELQPLNPSSEKSSLTTPFVPHHPDYFGWLTSPFLCPDCSNGFSPIESPICPQCGMVFIARGGIDHLCGDCIISPKKFRMARASGLYDHTLMEMIHRFKYQGKIQLVRPLGLLLFSAFNHFWGGNRVDLVIPVPLHIKRFRMRGFNQAHLLIKDWPEFAETFNLELSELKICRDILVRNRWTDPQTGLERDKRLSNIKNAFSVIDDNKVLGKKILLVDDVYTTGATVNECAKTLLKSGAQCVDVLTLARAA